MTLVQDPSDPTGISHDTPRGNGDISRARARKANAALALAAKNIEWDDIAEQLGYPSGDVAKMATERALEDSLGTPESQAYLRTLAHRRMEEMVGATYTQAIDTDHPDQLAYLREARKTIMEDADLLGYKAPKEFVVTSPTTAQLEAWVSRVVAEKTVDIPEADIFEADIVDEP